ncbi:MAG: IPT/TIG domain-containing protein [Candidatus Nomurabacteria bacterium]|jgi:hypothetical protein|nr:IPT/TIG domain-containing protein [Candidatus Nomurabacteria bacterium]
MTNIKKQHHNTKAKTNKWLFSAVFAVLGLFTAGAVAAGGFIAPEEAGATDISIEIIKSPMMFNVDTPIDGQSGGNTYPVTLTGENVNTVDVYLDGSFFETININDSAAFSSLKVGNIILPNSVGQGPHLLEFTAHVKDGVSPDISRQLTVVWQSNAPQIDKVDPDVVPTEGGRVIRIFGSSFTGTSQVYVDDTQCTNFSVISDSEIDCAVPPHVASYVNVSVATKTGIYTRINALRYAEGLFPWIPNTGAFRIGDKIVTTHDVAAMLLCTWILFMILALSVIVCRKCFNKNSKRSKKTRKTTKKSRKTIKKPARKSAKPRKS